MTARRDDAGREPCDPALLRCEPHGRSLHRPARHLGAARPDRESPRPGPLDAMYARRRDRLATWAAPATRRLPELRVALRGATAGTVVCGFAGEYTVWVISTPTGPPRWLPPVPRGGPLLRVSRGRRGVRAIRCLRRRCGGRHGRRQEDATGLVGATHVTSTRARVDRLVCRAEVLVLRGGTYRLKGRGMRGLRGDDGVQPPLRLLERLRYAGGRAFAASVRKGSES